MPVSKNVALVFSTI